MGLGGLGLDIDFDRGESLLDMLRRLRPDSTRVVDDMATYLPVTGPSPSPDVMAPDRPVPGPVPIPATPAPIAAEPGPGVLRTVLPPVVGKPKMPRIVEDAMKPREPETQAVDRGVMER